MLKTIYCLSALLLFSLNNLSAQDKKPKIKFGKISEEEIAMKSYPSDPAAPAVVLFDVGEFSASYNSGTGFTIYNERHVRIKIFNKDAYGLANVRIIFHKNEKVTDLKASSYNLENGTLVETKLDKDENVFEEKLTRSASVKKLTLPAVKEGTIIEYRYGIINDDLPDWVFQRQHIPTIWSEFTATVPTFIEYNKMSQGWHPFSVAEQEERNINISGVAYTANYMHFVQENIPALKPEPFVQSPSDYLSQINFDIRAKYEVRIVPSGTGYQLINSKPNPLNETWQTLGKELLEDYLEDPLKSSSYTQEDALKCAAGKSSEAEKVAAIYEFVGKNYQIQDYESFWLTDKMEHIVKYKKGSPTDVNIVLINMLQRAKINAYPLAISTQRNGRILPFRVSNDAFDRILTAVENPDKSFTVIDAAAWPNPIGLLPEEDLNNEGLLIKDKKSIEWLPLKNTVLVRSALQSELSVAPDGKFTGKLTFSESGYGAVKARKIAREKNALAYVQEHFKELADAAEFSNVALENMDQWQEPGIKGSFEMVSTNLATVSGNKIYVSPILGLGLKENPFKNPERKFDIELGTAQSRAYYVSIKLPPGYKIDEAPKSIKMTFGDNNALQFEYIAEPSAEACKFSVRFIIKTPYVSVEHYADLQQFYGNILAKFQEQLVLTKL